MSVDRNQDTENWDQVMETLRSVAEDKPLAHPTSFGLRHMDYEFAPPPHLLEIETSAYKALHPEKHQNTLKNIVRLMPREHGKSEIVSHKIPAWLALNNPNSRILIMMESEQQAAGKLEQCAETIRRLAPQYGREIENDSYKKLKLKRSENHSEPTILAAGFETSITGGHFDLIVFDDLVSADTMMTEQRRDKAWMRFQDYLNLGSAGQTCFLVAGTRKHPDDIYQKMIDSSGWDVEVRKAISDFSIVENGEYDVITTDGVRYAAGEKPHDANIARVDPQRDVPVLWPERWPLDILIQKYIEGTVETEEGEDEDRLSGSRVWIRENQNRADALMGQVLNANMLEFVDGLPEGSYREMDDLFHYVGLDLALEPDAEKAATNDTDYFAYAVAAYDPRNHIFYIRDYARKRGLTMKEAIDWFEGAVDRTPTRNVYIESNQGQRFFAQEAADTKLWVNEVQATGKKEDRILSMSAKFENRNAVVVGNKNSAKGQTLISEWTQFPTGDHDDLLDAFSIALEARAEEQEDAKNTTEKPFI